MHTTSVLSLAVMGLAPIVSAGVSVQGFSDTQCQSGVGNNVITSNGGCSKFNTGYTSFQVAGGGSASCNLMVFNSDDCTGDPVGQALGINDPNLGTCLPTSNTANSGFLSNCPT